MHSRAYGLEPDSLLCSPRLGGASFCVTTETLIYWCSLAVLSGLSFRSSLVGPVLSDPSAPLDIQCQCSCAACAPCPPTATCSVAPTATNSRRLSWTLGGWWLLSAVLSAAFLGLCVGIVVGGVSAYLLSRISCPRRAQGSDRLALYR